MNLLDDIRGIVGDVFGDTALFFSDAVLTRTNAGTGWGNQPGTPETFPCKAMRSDYSDHLRAVADIPGTDVKLMIVGASITTKPQKGDRVTLNGQAYIIKDRITTDPATAMWEAQASPVNS